MEQEVRCVAREVRCVAQEVRYDPSRELEEMSASMDRRRSGHRIETSEMEVEGPEQRVPDSAEIGLPKTSNQELGDVLYRPRRLYRIRVS